MSPRWERCERLATDKKQPRRGCVRRLQQQETRRNNARPWLQIPRQTPRTGIAEADLLRWVGLTLCLLWMSHQLSRLITLLRQWGQRDPLSQAFQQELLRRGLLLR